MTNPAVIEAQSSGTTAPLQNIEPGTSAGSISRGVDAAGLTTTRATTARHKASWLYSDYEIALSETLSQPLPPLRCGQPVNLEKSPDPLARQQKQESLRRLAAVSMTNWPDFAFDMVEQVEILQMRKQKNPASLVKLSVAGGGEVWHDPNAGVFTASKKNLTDSVQVMVAAARSKGWNTIEIAAGDEKFKQAVWLEAQRQGVSLTGYTPSRDLVGAFARESQSARLDALRLAVREPYATDAAARERCRSGLAPWIVSEPADAAVCPDRMEILREADPQLADSVAQTVSALSAGKPGAAIVARRLEAMRETTAPHPEDCPSPMRPGGP